MDANEFLRDLVASYPQGLRPDVDFLNIIRKEIAKRPCNSQIYQAALSNIQGAFRMFPGIPDIKWAFSEAFKTVKTKSKKGVEYFDLNKNTYAREVDITDDGEIVRKPLPCGATNYLLCLPPEFEANREFLTAEQAYAEGCISEELYAAVRSRNEKHPYKGRFEKIGEYIHKEEPPVQQPLQLPVIDAEFEDIDDSMAANPEENFSDYEDI